MTREEIRKTILQNLQQSGIEEADIRIQADPFIGWRIAVVSKGFLDRSLEERKKLVLQGLQNIHIEWLDLLTPEEQDWAGALPADLDVEDLPLWPEALARGAQEELDVTFPSDLDEDLPRPLVVSFFSLRGGVGRSTALAYTGRMLAAKGRKVVCVDMDLEAPGLAALFGCEEEVQDHQGVVELLVQLDQGSEPDFSKHLIPVIEGEDLYCLPAGRPDANYARLLSFIDPSSWYREAINPLKKLLKGLETQLPFKPDAILLDARTGINPLNAPLLFDLADLAIVVFFPHPQARTGTKALVRALLAAKTQRRINNHRLTPDIRFLVSPIPATKAKEVVERYEHRALDWIGDWMSPVHAQQDRPAFLDEEITNFITYREVIASSDSILDDKDAWRDFEIVLEWVERFLPARSEERTPVSLADHKKSILDRLRFATGTAEQQEDFLETFVETDVFSKAMRPEIPLVLGRKGTGKTAVFRRLTEDPKTSAAVIQAPSPFRRQHHWLLGPDGFKGIDDVLVRNKATWSQFWSFYTCIAIQHGPRDFPKVQPNQRLENFTAKTFESELDIVTAFEELIHISQFGLLIGDWLTQIDRRMDSTTLLLFDGLDTGFGNSEEDRQRRAEAIAGLFVFWMDREAILDKLKFKILLREDIWRKLKFENKSHLFGRSVTLTWKEKVSFFKVVIKQALRVEDFQRLLEQVRGMEGIVDTPLENWGGDEVYAAWNLLVGERMKGGKTAFTRNWVWNRLADGNQDHSPRYLLQLFHTVTEWEKQEHARSSYEKSIIRPRALAACLPTVSEQALDALKEEFGELDLLLEKLQGLGRTPVSANDLSGFDRRIQLALEVGLLAVYEGTAETVERYKVPEIYRHALGMTRKGQM